MLLLALLSGLLAGVSWAADARRVDTLQPDLRESSGLSYLQVDAPAMADVPVGHQVRDVTLAFRLDLPAGTTVQLWSTEGEGLPWESEGGTLVDTWTLDERTGDRVEFDLPPVLWGESALWVRLDPAEEDVVITTATVKGGERVTTLDRERRRSR